MVDEIVEKDGEKKPFVPEPRDLEILEELKNRKIQLDSADVDIKKPTPIASIVWNALYPMSVVMATFFGMLAIITLCYFQFFTKGGIDYWILFFGMTTVAMFFVVVFFIASIIRAGQWYSVGKKLAEKKGDLWLFFTRSGKVIARVEKNEGLNYFWPKDAFSRFLVVKNGYTEPSTGATVRTVKEGMTTDFDVNEEYKQDIAHQNKLMNMHFQQEFELGKLWEKNQGNMQLILLILVLILAGGAVGVGAMNYFAIKDATAASLQQAQMLDHDLNIVNESILNSMQRSVNPNAVIVGGAS